MPMWFDGEWFWPMWLVMTLFWVALIWFGIWAVRQFTQRPEHGDPRRILEERFARGEIDEEEFERRRGALERGR